MTRINAFLRSFFSCIFQSSTAPTPPPPALPLSPRTTVIGTIFGPRRGGHLWFCFQRDRFSAKPLLLLELSVPTSALIQEMQCGVVRVGLESPAAAGPELSHCHLHSVPVWTLSFNGRKIGFAARRKATEQNRLMFKSMENVTVGAGLLPCGFGPGSEEIMFMRANYERVVRNADSESFNLINPNQGTAHQLSVFLKRTR